MHRTKRSLFNVVVTLVTNIIILVTAFIVQRVFVSRLGSDYNGINGLFTSVISMMSLTDLGIGSAIIYHLYRPVAEDDQDTICSLLTFYRNSYIIISVVVLLIGVILLFFMPQLVGDIQIRDNLYLIFGLFMADCLCSYFLSYKKSLLYAYQMNYVLDGVHFGFYMIQNLAQIIVLWYYNDYISFLLIKTIFKCFENWAISLYIRKKYSFTNKKKVAPLDKHIKNDIYVKIKALLFHRLGKLFITGSDSLVITGVLGILQMSLYTNYHMILGGITALLNKIFETLTSSVGNFLIGSSTERRYEVYRNMDFLNFWFFGLGTVALYVVLRPFMILWLGEEYLFSNFTVFILMIKFYQEGMRASVTTFKDAAGIYYEDRFIPIAEAVINVCSSLILAKVMGIAGVFLGTVIGSTIVYFYSFPKYVCKPLFGMEYREYVWQTVQHFLFVILTMVLVVWCGSMIHLENLVLQVIANGLISIIVFHVLLIGVYWRSAPFKYYLDIALKLILRSF